MNGRPLVLLDVDGVVSIGLYASSKFRARMMFHDKPNWYSGRAFGHPQGTRIFLDRRWGPMVRSIAGAGADLAWATRWEMDANYCIGPLLGLPSLPVVPVNHVIDDVLQPKARLAVPWAQMQRRPWAWIDNEPGELDMATAMTHGGEHPFLPVLTESTQGLMQEDADKVIAWIRSLP